MDLSSSFFFYFIIEVTMSFANDVVLVDQKNIIVLEGKLKE